MWAPTAVDRREVGRPREVQVFRRWSSLVLHSAAGPKPSGTKQKTVATEWLSKHGCQGFSRLLEAPVTGLGRVRSRVCLRRNILLSSKQIMGAIRIYREGKIQFPSRNNCTTGKTQQLSFHCVSYVSVLTLSDGYIYHRKKTLFQAKWFFPELTFLKETGWNKFFLA